jgi:hypothetical protein
MLAQKRIRHNAVTAIGHLVSWLTKCSIIGSIICIHFVFDDETKFLGRDLHFSTAPDFYVEAQRGDSPNSSKVLSNVLTSYVKKSR